MYIFCAKKQDAKKSYYKSTNQSSPVNLDKAIKKKRMTNFLGHPLFKLLYRISG